MNITTIKASPNFVIEFSTAINRSLRFFNCECSSSESLMSMGCNIMDINSATRQKSLRSLKRNPKSIKYRISVIQITIHNAQ